MQKNAWYLLEPSRSSFQQATYQFNAWYELSLPGVVCPLCGNWATCGVSYPSIQNPELRKVLDEVGDDPLSVDEWKKAAERVRKFAGKERVIEPGTSFGPLKGSFGGTTIPLMWLNSWTPLLAGRLLSRAAENGINLHAMPSGLQSAYGDDTIWDLEIRPMAKLSGSSANICPVCGRIDCVVPEKVTLSKKDFDETVPLQRVVELPTLIIASHGFIDLVRSIPDRDATVTPVLFK